METETLSRTRCHASCMRQISPIYSNKSFQCHKTELKSHQPATTKCQIIRKQYRHAVLSSKESKKTVASPSFVTKVQIKKTINYNMLNTTKLNSNTQQSNMAKTGKQTREQKLIDNNNAEEKNKQALDSLGSVNRVPRSRNVCSIDLSPVEESEFAEHENVQHLTRKLTVKMRKRHLALKLGRKARNIPTATYARPTKGEIALSQKAPQQFHLLATSGATKKQNLNVVRPLLTPDFDSSSHSDSVSPDMTLRGSNTRTVPGLVKTRPAFRASRSAAGLSVDTTVCCEQGEDASKKCIARLSIRIPSGSWPVTSFTQKRQTKNSRKNVK